MDVMKRFERMIKDSHRSEKEFFNSYQKIKDDVIQIEKYCCRIKNGIDLLMNEFDTEEEYEQNTPNYTEVTELPVNDYLELRCQFGEEMANKVYYGVKTGQVSLKFIQQQFLCKSNM